MCLFSKVYKLGTDEKDSLELAKHSIAYLCGVQTAFEYQRNIKPQLKNVGDPVSAKVFRLGLIEDSYLISDLKFMALNLCFRSPSVANLKELQLDFNVVRNDVVLLRKCFSNRRWRNSLKASDRIKSLTLQDVTLAGRTRLQGELPGIIKAIMPSIKSVVYRKMRFLVNSENMELTDYHNELMCKALQAYYTMIPTNKTDAHVVNCLRVTCNNHALNIISARTSIKRRRMDNTGADGFGGYSFSLKTVSENQMAVMADGTESSYEDSLNANNEGHADRLVSLLSYERLLRRMGKTTVRENILSVLSGHECPKFTEYLINCNVIRDGEDCIDFVERNGFPTIVRRMSAFYRVAPEKLSRFLEHVGRELKEGRTA